MQNERFYIIVLDDQCKPLKDLFMAEGVPNRVTIDMRKLLRDVARTNGTCAILAHNHPTGLPLPSQKDIMTTLAVMRTLSQLGVPVLDHIIVAGEDACSMAQRGCMPAHPAHSAGCIFCGRMHKMSAGDFTIKNGCGIIK